MKLTDVDTAVNEALPWRLSEDQKCWTARTANRIYQIVMHADRRWQLRVRSTEEPTDVPLDDLWQTLNFYNNPAVAMIQANYHNDDEAAA